MKLQGIGVSEGIRMGKAYIYHHIDRCQFTETTKSINTDAELDRLRTAKGQCLQELSGLIEKTQKNLGQEKAAILKGQQSFLSDPAFYPAMEKMIANQHCTAEKAVDEIVNKFVAIFEGMPNAYMKERASDIKDVGRRLHNILSGHSKDKLSDIQEEMILVADELTPSDTIQLDKKYILAFITKTGGKTSHTAIFSRSLGIPAIVGIGEGINNIHDGDFLIVDGTTGICIVNPEQDIVREYEYKKKEEEEQNSIFKENASEFAETKDGYRVDLEANVGTPEEAENASRQGADGIGLYRTEFLYLASDKLPDEETQYETYKRVVQTMDNKPVVIRTLDIGGDKELPYMSFAHEMNPFLGYRAIRLCLDQKDLFVIQLRAILRASAYGNIKIMFPMISGLEEWREVKEIYNEVKEQLEKENIPFDPQVELGIMIEVPSAALLAGQFAKEVDFFSIGTNDLAQYTLAVDRMNEKIAYLYDYFHPAVLYLIKNTIDAAHREKKWVGMCGGMAGDPMAVPLLVGMGLDKWSMSAVSIQKIKYMISHVTQKQCSALLEEVMNMKTAKEIRTQLSRFHTEILRKNG